MYIYCLHIKNLYSLYMYLFMYVYIYVNKGAKGLFEMWKKNRQAI